MTDISAGSSPRMRGTLLHRLASGVGVRIIPAHAGNSLVHGTRSALLADHPRACGELGSKPTTSGTGRGSSPRMRGTHVGMLTERRLIRIIPAHAGNSSPRHDHRSRHTDHPRACGELTGHPIGGVLRTGSSPRMRGTQAEMGIEIGDRRIIPAHAGNSSSRRGSSPIHPDHPRACGELHGMPLAPIDVSGSSPRMRGTHSQKAVIQAVRRIIPAHAGNSGDCVAIDCSAADHPRACGELSPRPDVSSR